MAEETTGGRLEREWVIDSDPETGEIDAVEAAQVQNDVLTVLRMCGGFSSSYAHRLRDEETGEWYTAGILIRWSPKLPQAPAPPAEKAEGNGGSRRRRRGGRGRREEAPVADAAVVEAAVQAEVKRRMGKYAATTSDGEALTITGAPAAPAPIAASDEDEGLPLTEAERREIAEQEA